MARYIDADKLTSDYIQSYTANADTYLILRRILGEVPTADVVEVKADTRNSKQTFKNTIDIRRVFVWLCIQAK